MAWIIYDFYAYILDIIVDLRNNFGRIFKTNSIKSCSYWGKFEPLKYRD